ncbi:hypothetical protein SDC9_159188 [bioreactor metagenome]|uniref:Uncharacterized protein n=1 Tax=bioreactor metagenome TaxID=1076179 RepID=A0A645FEV4_9ZZZZ
MNSCSRLAWVATIVPLPGRANPIASLRQFMELAVNIPEQEPQVGQAALSTLAICASEIFSSAACTIASTRSSCFPSSSPASIGPPETKTVGIFSRMVAISIPGVILSQLEIQIMASALWAFTMYSTLSAIRSRDGREYNIPSCPMAIPSSMAMVLNSAAKQPSFSISAFTFWPM